MKCKDCKYWRKYEESEHFGECTSGKFVPFEYVFHYKKESPDTVKYDGEQCGVDVGSEFGCIHFESK